MRHRVDRSYSQGLDCVRAYVATQRFRSQRSRPNKNISCAWRNLVVFFPNLPSRRGIAFCVAKVEKRQESDTVGRKWDRWNRQRIARPARILAATKLFAAERQHVQPEP